MQRRLHQTLFILLTIRLLLPPGICVCQWHSPAARMVVNLLNTGKEVPPPPPVEKEDDHEPGCPASKLAAGMGLRPASPPSLPPAVSPEIVSEAESFAVAPTRLTQSAFPTYRPPTESLYLTGCALLI
jgi:hypothetical protein